MDVRLEPWAVGDLDLVRRLNGDAAMMEHLGGPESEDQLARRQARYEQPGSGMYKVLAAADGRPVGSVGFWEREWLGATVLETGWSVLPEFQGRGIGTRSLQLACAAAFEDAARPIHGYPSVDNDPSNAMCRRAGLRLAGEIEVERRPGRTMRVYDWVLEPDGAAAATPDPVP